MTVYAVYKDGQLQGSHARASVAAEVCQELTERHPGAVVFFLTVASSSIPTEIDEHIWNPFVAAEMISEARTVALAHTDRRHDKTRAAKRAEARQQPPDLFAPLGQEETC
jgi:hypothetical protein